MFRDSQKNKPLKRTVAIPTGGDSTFPGIGVPDGDSEMETLEDIGRHVTIWDHIC